MTYLVKPNWIGFDGQPITGVIPPRMRLMSGVMTPTLASEVAHRYRMFHINKQASKAEYFVSDTSLADGSRLRIVANGSIEDVLVWSVTQDAVDDGETSALAYPVVPLPPYAPIFDRYVFNRSNPPPPMPDLIPYPAYPELPDIPSPPELPVNFKELWVIFEPNSDGGIVQLIVLELAADAPPAITYEYLTTNGQVVAQSTSLLGGIVTDAGVLFTNPASGYHELPYPMRTLPNGSVIADLNEGVHTLVWLAGVRNFTVNSDEAASDAILSSILAHNAPIKAAIISAMDAYHAQVNATNAARDALIAAWEAACDQVDIENAALMQQWQAQMDAYLVIDATTESVTLRKTGRAAQISAYKAWLDGGINDRHVTWAIFDIPAMTASKPVLPVDFTLGSAPLDSEGYEDDVGYYAHYMLTRANRETVLDAGSGGGGDN